MYHSHCISLTERSATRTMSFKINKYLKKKSDVVDLKTSDWFCFLDKWTPTMDISHSVMITILSSSININEGPYNNLMSMKVFTLTVNKRFKWAPQIMRNVVTTSIFKSCYPFCNNCVVHILGEVYYIVGKRNH